MSVPCATLHYDPFSTLSSSYTKNKSCCQFSYQTLHPALGSIVRTKGLFVSASQELPGYGSQKLKQTTNFWGGLFGCRKATEPSLEWEAEKEEKQNFHSFGLKFIRKAQKS
jgi:hypothetical protein